MFGWRFSDYKLESSAGNAFEQLLDVFRQLLLYTSGDVREALAWLTELDKEYQLTDDSYGLADFIQDLMDEGFLKREEDGRRPKYKPSSKLEIYLRRKTLEEVFGKLSKTKVGNHNTRHLGKGDERTSDIRPYEYGDALDHLAMSESLKNAQVNHGIGDFVLGQDDLRVYETLYQSQMSTVLMIDISHSMILYGEDRITPAKKVALALAEFIRTKYPKDTLDILVFGNDAWEIKLKDLPYLEVGPYHTNTVAGLELAMKILRRRKNPNKQVFMITDGKPTCIKQGKKYYKNPYGLDRKIMNRTLNLAVRFRKQNVPITTFMVASDPYLRQFVQAFTEVNRGKAFYSSLDGLGEFVLKDYSKRKSKRY